MNESDFFYYEHEKQLCKAETIILFYVMQLMRKIEVFTNKQHSRMMFTELILT